MSSEISSIKQDVGEIPENPKNSNPNEADNKEKSKNFYEVATIIVGSTNFFFNFKDTKETIPVLLLFHKEEKFFGEEVINKLQEKKYLYQSMIFFDFLYYLDKIYETSKETLIKRNLYNKDLSFIDKKLDNLDVKEKIELENKRLQIISFEFAYSSSEDKKSRVGLGIKKAIPSNAEGQKPKTVQPTKNLNSQYFTSEQLLNMYIENLFDKKLKNLKEKFNLKLILPLFLSEAQKDKIEKIFKNKLSDNENFKNIVIGDEMKFYLEKIKTKIENKKVDKTSEKTQNKIIFIHFGGSSLVAILYDCDAGKIIKKKEKLIGGIDIDITLTKDCLAKFKNDNNGVKITDVTPIYKVKNLIEEEKKNYIQIIKIK